MTNFFFITFFLAIIWTCVAGSGSNECGPIKLATRCVRKGCEWKEKCQAMITTTPTAKKTTAPTATSSTSTPVSTYKDEDFVSSELQKRRTIQIGENCDGVFGTKLEAIVTEMEDHKDGGLELNSRLRNQFTKLMDQKKEVFLCVKTSWCDKNICKNREAKHGREEGNTPKASDAAADATTPPTQKTPEKEEEGFILKWEHIVIAAFGGGGVFGCLYKYICTRKNRHRCILCLDVCKSIGPCLSKWDDEQEIIPATVTPPADA